MAAPSRAAVSLVGSMGWMPRKASVTVRSGSISLSRAQHLRVPGRALRVLAVEDVFRIAEVHERAGDLDEDLQAPATRPGQPLEGGEQVGGVRVSDEGEREVALPPPEGTGPRLGRALVGEAPVGPEPLPVRGRILRGGGEAGHGRDARDHGSRPGHEGRQGHARQQPRDRGPEPTHDHHRWVCRQRARGRARRPFHRTGPGNDPPVSVQRHERRALGLTWPNAAVDPGAMGHHRMRDLGPGVLTHDQGVPQ